MDSAKLCFASEIHTLHFTTVTSVFESILERRRNDNQRANDRAVRLALLTERQSMPFNYFRVFHCISKTVRKVQAFIKPSNLI